MAKLSKSELRARKKTRQRRYYLDRLFIVTKIVSDAKDKPCCDCGHRFPRYVMDLDHVRGVKKFNISCVSSMCLRKGIVEMLKKEIAKCDVVCANCHRVRTHESNRYVG